MARGVKGVFDLHKYEIAFNYIQKMVRQGVLLPGSKIPSIRKLSQQLGLSPITVQHSYDLLQAQGLVVAKPRSGYFVPGKEEETWRSDSAQMEGVSGSLQEVTISELTYSTLSHWYRRELGGFGGMNPHPEIMKHSQAGRFLRQVSRRSSLARTSYDPPEGNIKLREGIAKILAERGLIVSPADIVTTGIAMQGFELCLDLATEPGETVLVDTPTYLPLLASLKRKALKALEIYSHPTHGVDPGQFAYLIANYNIRTAVLSPLNHFPTGTSYSRDVMRQLAAIAEEYGVTIIETDMFAELNHGSQASSPLMTYSAGNKFYLCGSFLHTLGADYSVGWVFTRGLSRVVTEQKYVNNLMFGDTLLQRALGDYISERQHEKDLKKLQRTMLERTRRGVELLKQTLPSGFIIYPPDGGYMCWMRGPMKFDALAASKRALDINLSLTAGPMFSPSNGFQNFMGINLSGPWTEDAAEPLYSMAAIFGVH